jgi:hypothetical protein
MTSDDFDITQYTILSAERDLQLDVIEGKLEALVRQVPAELRPQVDRCYKQAFIYTLKWIARDGFGTTVEVPYFTEDPQDITTHRSAYRTLVHTLAYAYSLGGLVHSTGAQSDLAAKITETARRVFSFAAPQGPLPDSDRSDLSTLPTIVSFYVEPREHGKPKEPPLSFPWGPPPHHN